MVTVGVVDFDWCCVETPESEILLGNSDPLFRTGGTGDNKTVVVQGELPHERNRRGGPGWWMDLDGVWRGPEEWPEDYPPIDGWVLNDLDQWCSPGESEGMTDLLPARRAPEPKIEPAVVDTLSRQAQSDRRAMYTVAGVVGGACLLLAAVLIVITQAGAASNGEPGSDEPDVVFAAETDQDRINRQRALSLEAPAVARQNLVELPETPAAAGSTVFDPVEWIPVEEGCVDVVEAVLIARSSSPIVWADQLQCVPDRGQWRDRYLDVTLTRILEADVVALVPPAVAFASGGASWSSATRQAYVTDQHHPATLQIISAGAGHNPRAQDPSAWKPSSPDIWCAYAVDWISVKTHWQLSVTSAERAALDEMLDTCDSSTTSGADPETVVIDRLAAPDIELLVAAE